VLVVVVVVVLVVVVVVVVEVVVVVVPVVVRINIYYDQIKCSQAAHVFPAKPIEHKHVDKTIFLHFYSHCLDIKLKIK